MDEQTGYDFYITAGIDEQKILDWARRDAKKTKTESIVHYHSFMVECRNHQHQVIDGSQGD